uniref:LrgB family protein n=1 Tax=Ilyobacter sp. TaxID=3100343 RepID=UPI0035627E85
MENLLNNPLFGVILSLGAFEIGKFIYSKTRFAIFNPLLMAISLIILLLLNFNIPFESYNEGGKIIVFFLGPATVVLAVPLYKQSELFKKHFFPIFLGIVVGALTAMTSVVVMGKMVGLDIMLIRSFIPKSITTPIGIEVSKALGGEPSITIMGILITGITGYIVSPMICKLFKINNFIAKGVGIGVASHAIGTTKALEMG